MQSEIVDIDSLNLDPANVRQRDERARKGIRASLETFGPGRSIVLDGKGIVRAGNGTIEAARAAGITEVLIVDPEPGQLVAVRRADWSATEATAYAIADNRLTDLSTFREPDLAEQLRALQSDGFGLDAVGYTDGEVDRLCEALGTRAIAEAGGLPEPGDDQYREQYGVIVMCDDEASQERVYGQLVELGLNCRVVCT